MRTTGVLRPSKIIVPSFIMSLSLFYLLPNFLGANRQVVQYPVYAIDHPFDGIISIVSRCAPNRIALIESLIERLPAGEARHACIPGQSQHANALFGIHGRGCEISLDCL